MALPIRTVLLAVAALAAVGVAVLRSVDAANHVIVYSNYAEQPLEYGATAAQQSAAFARLHVPPGFTRVACRGPAPREETMCFHSARALPLRDTGLEAVLVALGARSGPSPPTECGPPARAAVNRVRGWRFRDCHGAAVVGREQLLVLAHSLKVGPPPRSRRLRKVSSYERVFGPGTEVEVYDAGHRLPPGITERDLSEGCVKRAC